MTAFCLNDGSGRIKFDNFLVVKNHMTQGWNYTCLPFPPHSPPISMPTPKNKREDTAGAKTVESKGPRTVCPPCPNTILSKWNSCLATLKPVLDCGLCNFSALHHEFFSSRPLNVNVWSTSFGLEWPDWPFKKKRHSFVHFFTKSDAFVAAQNWNAHTTPQRPDARGNAGEYTNITIYLHDHVLNTHVSTRCHYRVSCSTRKSTNRRPNTTLPWKKGSSHALRSQNC